uniref:Mucin 20, cell surface associated n=1 Tax=Catagonus wagneri TaxID=51154 RepID=A0A8C3YS15_9CETA
VVVGAPANMGCLWGLALPLFFFCWETGVPGSSAGHSTNGSDHTDVPAVTPGAGTSSDELFWTTDITETSVPSHIPLETQTLSTQTSDRAFIPGGTISEAETQKTKTIFPAVETRALMKTMPSKSVVVTMPLETSATSGSPMGMTTVETVTGKDLLKAIFDTLCTFDSSEEAKTIMVDFLTLAHSSAEAKASESSTSSDGSVPAITSQALLSNITTLAKVLVSSNITIIKVFNCSVMETEATATTSGNSHINHRPTGGKALSAPDISAFPDSARAKSHLTRTTASAETLSTASATESTTPDSTLTISSTTVTETTVAKTTTPSETLVTVSTDFSEGNSTLSVGTTNHTKVSEAITTSTEAGSTVGKATSPAGFSDTAYSLPEVATIVDSTPSEHSTTGSTFGGPVPPISRKPLPSVHPTTANGSRETNITLAKTTASAKPSKMASTVRGKPSRATPTTAQTRWTNVTAGRDGGFLLLRLSVVSPEDLTDPTVAERLMQQFHRELQALMPPIQVSLLRVRRG